MKICACGCGREVKGRGVYFHGHRPKDTIETVRDRLCECGCGQPLLQTKHRSGHYHHARFLPGHATRVALVAPHRYTPTTDEIPTGLCECGCGQQTPIATYTARRLRYFKGHPRPYIPEHGLHAKTPNPRGPKSKHFVGRRRSFQGYIYVYRPDHPLCSKGKNMLGYIREHRVVWEEANGRLLDRREDVHHVNGIKDDNRPENLIALSKADHRRLHASEAKQFLSASAQISWD